MNRSTWKAETALTLLMAGGFFVHLISLCRHLYLSVPAPASGVIFVPVDVTLLALMLWALAGMVLRYRVFLTTFDMSALWRRIVHWGLVVYIMISIPGHVLFLASGDRSYFDQFAWWYSLAILPFFALVILYVTTLRRQPVRGEATR